MEAVNNLGNKVISGSKGANAMAHQISATNSVNIVYDDEFDNSVTALNIVRESNFGYLIGFLINSLYVYSFFFSLDSID